MNKSTKIVIALCVLIIVMLVGPFIEWSKTEVSDFKATQTTPEAQQTRADLGNAVGAIGTALIGGPKGTPRPAKMRWNAKLHRLEPNQ